MSTSTADTTAIDSTNANTNSSTETNHPTNTNYITLPLTACQRDIWVSAAQHPRHPQFNEVVSARLDGELDLEMFRAGVLSVLRRNDAWRLRFGEADGRPYQWFAPGDPDVSIVDFRGEPDAPAKVAAWIEGSMDEPFDLLDENGPLFRVALLRESDRVTHLYGKAHHIVADGWTVNLLLTQALEEYEHRLRTGWPAERPATTFRDVLHTESQYLGTPGHDADRTYFKSELENAEPALFTRTSRPGSRKSGHYFFTVAGEHVQRMMDEGITPSVYLSAALGLYLCRYHRVDEVVIGVPFANRSPGDAMLIWGEIASILPLRIAAPVNATMRELTDSTMASLLALRSHQRISLGEVFQSLGAHAAGPRQLFDVALSYLSLPTPTTPPGLDTQTTAYLNAHDQDALSIVVRSYEGDSQLYIDLHYARDVFDEDLPIEGFASALRTLIERGLADLDRPISSLPLTTDEQRRALINLGTGPRVAFREDATLHSLFAEQAARTPDAIAAVAPDGTATTYAELDALADRIALGLAADGVRVGERVGVLMERGSQLLPALLGVLKAGAAYVPIDPGYPAERISYLLDDSKAKVVLTSAASAPSLDAQISSRIRTVDDLLAATGDTAPDTTGAIGGAGPTDLAYVIYTSGSSGNPKGAMVEHRSVVNRLAWMQRAYPIGPGDVLLQKTPISFDVSVWELFWWGIEGAAVALLPPGAEKDPRRLLDAVRERGVSTLHFVPSMLGPLLDLLEETPDLRADLRSLRRVFCSGEALPPARVEQFNRIFADVPDAPRLINLYGPTEATVDVSYYDCPSDPARPVTRVPIGRPIDNLRLYVLDRDGLPQPTGVPGELYIAGVGVARGYLDRPELTQEKYLADPFHPGERMYRTGDLVRWLADGELEYLGRFDGQVKIRGNRVELGEVENALARLGGVRDAVVVDRHSPTRGTYLTGYYVADGDLDDTELRADLGRSLPEFMIPSLFARVEQIPLTPNGKADRKALARLAAINTPHLYQAPRDEREAALAAVWAGVLETERVGIHDNYYALGGDSITALRVRAAASKRGLHFSLTDLIQHPTVAELASRAVFEPDESAGDSARVLEPFDLVSKVDRARLEGAADAYPMTRLQLGMLFYSRQRRRSAVYQDVFRYTFTLPWHEDAFRSAFAALVARHPALRTGFALAGFAEPLQFVHAEAPTQGLEIVDLRSLPDSAAETEVLRHVEERRFHRYEFDRPPLYLLCAHVHADGIDLVLSFHHAILDGGSVANLLRELLQDYLHAVGVETGLGPVGEVAPPSPANYVVEERRALAAAESREYWLAKLDGASPTELPSFRPFEPEPGADRTDFTTHRADLPAGLEHAVQDFARTHQVPIKSVLFAAYCQTLRLYADGGEVVTGVITHGRPALEGAERSAGLFLNTLPVRLPAGLGSWLDAVRALFRQEQADHPHRHYPLSAILADLADAGHDTAALVETAFNYVNFHTLTPVFNAPEVRLREVTTWEQSDLKLLFNVVTDPRDGRLWLRLDCDGKAITQAQAELFASSYLDILRRMLDHADETADFAFLSPEPAALVHPASDAPNAVHAFELQAAKTPDAVALAFENTTWTYAQLDLAATALAVRLLAEGGTPGAMSVGVAVERSPEMIAAVLGAAKAGGACVPLDTSYPPARLAAMIAQARPFRVIANAAYAHLADDPGTLIPAESIDPDAHAVDKPELPQLSAETPAYVLFTSGSTGTPKGVVMPHRMLANLVAWQNRTPDGTAGLKTLQFAPLSFDVSFQEIFGTLAAGGTLQLVSETDRRDMAALLRLLDRSGVEQVFMPYVALQQLADAADALGIRPHALRRLHSAGEQLRVTPAIRRLCASQPTMVLDNQYGPTETHVVTSYPMSGDPAAFPMLPPIGRTLWGTEAHVLDPQLRPTPVGVRGEIYLGGVCLADGYLGRPDLTDERFIPHPHRPSSRLYRTGDIGMVLPSGDIAYLGRADTQAKVRGFRVEPGEIEHAIARLASDADAAGQRSIREAAVVVRRPEGGDAFLAAFLVGDPDAIGVEEIIKELRLVLPEYMVPTHVEWIDALPRTPSGKRDDEALRRRPLTRPLATAGITPAEAEPSDEYERVLAEVIADLLNLPRIGVRQNVFDLGATSLTAMRIVVTVEQRFGVNVPLSAFVAAPTVAGLAARLRDAGASAGYDPIVPIQPHGSARPLFLVHPAGGNVLCYLPLAKHLPANQPLYALQAAGSEPGTEPKDTIPDLARSYVEAMRRVQPQGPYSLGGWSFGGLVAFEMAAQLRSAGEEIAALIILDSAMPQPGAFAGATDDFVLTWFFWELLWLERGGATLKELIPPTISDLGEKFEYIARYAAEAGVLPAGSTSSVVRRLFNVYRANVLSIASYRPSVLDRDVTLLRAAQQMPPVLRELHAVIGSTWRDEANGWHGRTGGGARLNVVEVPGDHLTIMEEPRVRSLAEAIVEQIQIGR